MWLPHFPFSITKWGVNKFCKTFGFPVQSKYAMIGIAFDACILWGALNREEVLKRFLTENEGELKAKALLATTINRLEGFRYETAPPEVGTYRAMP